MKKYLIIALSLFVVLGFSACGGEETTDAGDGGTTTNTTDGDGDGATKKPKADRSKVAISTWQGQILTDEPAGKWKATLNFGEEMTLLGDTAYSEAKKKTYEKVELSSGMSGWIRADLIEKGATLGAITESASIYKRPGVSNITDEAFDEGELVVIGEVQDKWTSVIGKNDAGYHRKKGWLLGEDMITTNEQDVALAVMISKAMDEKNPVKKREELVKILDNSAFQNSVFYSRVEALAAESDPLEKLAEDELMITGNVVNVRSSAEITDDNKLFTVKAGDVCKVLEKGMMDEISGNTDYWYKIEKDAESGWIFGSNTSRAID